MPVSSLLERMRKKLQEKAAAAGAGASKDGTNDTNSNNNYNSNTGDENGLSTTSSVGKSGSGTHNASSSASHRAEPAVPLPPPVFASPSSARLDYRDVVQDPLCALFTADMAALIIERLLRSSFASSAELASAVTAAPCERVSAQGSPLYVDHGSVQSSSAVVDATVRHLHDLLTVQSNSSSPDKQGQQPPLHASSSSSPFTKSLYDDSAYQAACAQSHVDVSGSLRPVCRDVNFYSRVGRISQGVYGVVFKAVAAADEENVTGSVSTDLKNAGNITVSNNNSTKTGSPPPGRPRKYYALKHIKKMWLEESQIGFPPYLLREIDLLLRLRHPNIIGARELVLLDPTPIPQPPRTTVASRKLCHVHLPLGRRPREDGDTGATNEGLDDPSPPNHQRKKEAQSSVVPENSNGSNKEVGARPLAAVGTLSETKDVFLVMDFCPVDLTTYMRRYHTTPTCQIPYFHITSRNAHSGAAVSYVARAKAIAYQLFSAVAFLHANRVMHRDLKTSNVLLDDSGYVKVCDFGLGRLYREGQGLTPTVVTLMYRAPELHLGVVDYSHKMDVWSLGCILAELFLRRPLFHASTDSHHLLAVCDIIGIPTEETFPGLYHLPQTKVMMQSLPRWNRVSRLADLFKPGATMFTPTHGDMPVAVEATLLPPEGLELLKSILQWNPRRRPSAEEALQHPFFHTEPLPCTPAELMRPMPWQDAEHHSISAGRRLPPPATMMVAAKEATFSGAPLPTDEAQRKRGVLFAGAGDKAEGVVYGGDNRAYREAEKHVVVGSPTSDAPGRVADTGKVVEIGKHEDLLDVDVESLDSGPGPLQKNTLDVEGDMDAEREVRLAQLNANQDTEEVDEGR